MQRMDSNAIQLYAQKKYDYLIAKYSKANILGVFVVGLANYGFAEKDDKITVVGIYVPNFEDLCIKKAKNWNEEDIYMVDIRRLYNCLDTCKWGALELLFSDYTIINSIYESVFNSIFFNNRDIIARGHKKNRLSVSYEKMIDSFNKENYFNVARGLIAADLYILGCDCEDIFHLKKDYHIEYLENIKSDKSKINVGQMKNDLNELKNKIDNMINERNTKADTIIKEGIISLIEINLHNKISIDAFYAGLTKTENIAMKEILNRLDINGCGNISISKIVEETGISRPVFKNLFIKLEKDNIAKINNQGVKGTYINFDMSLFN